MMKLLILLFLTPFTLLSQNRVNGDSLVIYFDVLINKYRIDNGLNPIKVNYDLKNFTDEWSSHLSEVNRVYHGDGDLSFTNRVNNYPFIPSFTKCMENCTQAFLPSSPTPEDEEIISDQTQLLPYIEKIMKWNYTQKDFATYIMVAWKNSPSHNRSLLDPDINYYFVSSSDNGECAYFSWIAIE